jgi:hypothetical protein
LPAQYTFAWLRGRVNRAVVVIGGNPENLTISDRNKIQFTGFSFLC